MMKFSKGNIAYLEENYGKNILPLSIVENDRFPGSAPMEVFLYYKKGTPLEKLEECFFKTVEHYNLFSSRLIMIDDNKFALQYCKNGVVTSILPPVKVASNNLNVEDIKKMMTHVQTLPGEPLFAITGIPIEDGMLGALSCSHAICDGIAFMIFLHAWGCIIEGRDFPIPSPQRLFQGNPISFDKIDKAFIPPLHALSDKIQNKVKRNSNLKTYTKREYFSDDFLNDCKNEARSEKEDFLISNNQIVISFLLKKYHKHLLPHTDRIILKNPVNFRDVLPDIDFLYIGNAVFDSFTEFTKDEIDRMTIPQISYRLKESIANMRSESYVREIVYLSKYGLEFKPDAYKKNYPPYDVETDIFSANLTHLSDLESLGLGTNAGSILYLGLPLQTGFTMLKEKSGRMFAQITSRYPF